jgi:methionyl-tRNA formyltransferase
MENQVPDQTFATFPSKDGCRFAVLGSGKILCEFVRLLLQAGFPAPAIVTHPKEEHDRDRNIYATYPENHGIYEDVFALVEELGLDIYESKNVNESDVLEWLVARKVNVAMSVGCRSVIGANFLEFFDRKVINYHASDLPRYKGGGAMSWQILNGDTDRVAGTLHIIDEGIDTGDILIQEYLPVDLTHPYPADLFRGSVDLARTVLGDFLEKITEGHNFERILQTVEDSTYFPRLNTETHGAIDWSWSADCIERFIRAFGYPYPGAWTHLRSSKISIARAHLPETRSNFHPFVTGLIFRELEGQSVEVSTGDGSIVIESLRSEDGEIPAISKLRIGRRLHTPAAAIEEALAHRQVY